MKIEEKTLLNVASLLKSLFFFRLIKNAQMQGA